MDLLTLGFLLFCIVLVIVYYLVPKAMQWWILLAASLYFYAMSGIKNMIYVLITALSTYAATRMIQVFNRPPERMDQSQQKDNQ